MVAEVEVAEREERFLEPFEGCQLLWSITFCKPIEETPYFMYLK